jgi:hypothetical protein
MKNTHRILVGNPEENRTPGRLKNRWQENVFKKGCMRK